jgi:hypothetical protein
MAERPLTKKDYDFCRWFLQYRDYYRAAEKVGLAKNQAKRTYDRIEIQDEIERQQAVVEREQAKVTVAAQGITREMLDARLFQLINLDVKSNAGAVHRAIELGYVRAGVLQVGNTKSLDLTPPNPDDETPMPTVYQAMFTVGVSAATPIMPAVAPEAETPVAPVPAPTAFQRAVRALTTPPPQPAAAPATPAPAPSVIKAGRIKISR